MGHKIKVFLIILIATFISLMPIFDVSARSKRLSFEMEARLRDAYWWRPDKNMCANKHSTTNGSNVTIIGDSITEITSAGHTVNGSKHPDNHNDTNDFEEYLPEAEIYAQWGKSFWDDDGNDGGEGGKIILDRLASENALRDIVVYALGTNNENLSSGWVDYVVNTIGDNHTIVFMTMTDGGNPMTNNNKVVESAANKYDSVVIADWAGAAGSDPELYIDQNDTVHPSIHEGTKLFAETIYDAISCVSDTSFDDCSYSLGSYDGIATAGLSSLQSAFIDTYHEIAIKLSAEYGIPWEAVMAQGIIESASGTSNFARNRNNFFGLGAVDSNPDNAYSYSSPAEGWRGYYEFIEKNPRYRAHGAFNYPNDPYGYIAAIKAAGYATDPNYVSKVSSIIKAIQKRATEKGWSIGSILSSGYGSDNCSSISQGNGDINATALALSWPDRSHSINDPKPAYTTALAAVNLSSYGDEYIRIGASCDAFVATVMRYSGVDTNFPCCGADNILRYLQGAGASKYQKISNLSNASNLQPGDIRVKSSHVEIYVVDESGQGRIASASHGDRTADHGIGYYADSAYEIYRIRN